MKRNQREQKILPHTIFEFPKNMMFELYEWSEHKKQHKNSCRNVLIHQYKHHVFGKFQNRRGNIFCLRWFLFIISFLLLPKKRVKLDEKVFVCEF